MPRSPETRDEATTASPWFVFWTRVLAVSLDDPEADGKEMETGRGPATAHE